MLKIRMHAIYDHFPEHNPFENEPCIECYSDTKVFDCNCKTGRNIALLLEPKSMISDAYKFVAENPRYFEYIFTHDSELLELPQSRLLLWGDVWIDTDSKKTKGISICTSYKNWCSLHNARLELARYFENGDIVDVFFGDWNNPKIPNINPKDYLEEYKFSIVIENDIDEYWYTEKILNCFATKTIPIYVGATRIGDVFNIDGIIQVDNWKVIPEMVKTLNIDAEYEKRLSAIEDNYNRVKPYKVNWKQRFFNDYGDILEELLNE